MPKTTVVHCKREAYDVYIGRKNGDLPQSKWANTYVIGKDGTREEVIARYIEETKKNPELMGALHELRGKRLGCWCKGTQGTIDVPCHGDWLAEMANGLDVTNEPTTVDTKPIVDHMIQGATETLMKSVGKCDILPIFSSHYSFSPILTLEEAGKTQPGNPVSICDIAQRHKLQQVILVDERIDGFLEAYKNIQKAGIAHLIYGLKLCVVPDMANKEQESARQESNVIIFLKNTQAYHDLIRVWNRSWTDGFFTPARESGYGRIDWPTLKALWTPRLSLALPWASSFLARNMMTFSNIVPDLPVPANEVTLFKEADSGLPFASLLDDAVDRFAADTGAQIQRAKSVYYEDGERDFDTYVTYRAILNHGTWGAPEVPHLCSDRFSFTDFLRLSKEGQS